VVHRPVRRGQAPNVDMPIAVVPTQPSAAEAAARAATAPRTPPKGNVAEGANSSESVRLPNQRIPVRRDTRGTSSVNPRTLGPRK
jgi:hypothetical protein